MTTPENPPKLFVYSWENMSSRRVFAVVASTAEAERRLQSPALFPRTPVAEYILASVAVAATEAAVKKAIEEERARAWETAHVDE